MNQELSGALQEQIKKLPPEVQDAIASPDLKKKIGEIGNKNKLHIDQVGLLEDEVLLVMIGIEDPADFPDNIVQHVKLETSVAGKVAEDVAQQIFLPIREAMKKFMGEDSTPPASKNPSAMNMGKSVVMPSSVASAPKPTVTTPQASVPAPASAASMPPKPAAASAPAIAKPVMPSKPPEMHPADVMLTEKTVQVAPAAPNPAVPTAPANTSQQQAPKPEAPKPAAYKADPYREPPE